MIMGEYRFNTMCSLNLLKPHKASLSQGSLSEHQVEHLAELLAGGPAWRAEELSIFRECLASRAWASGWGRRTCVSGLNLSF